MSSFNAEQDREELVESQVRRLGDMLVPVLRDNAFYRRKLTDAGLSLPGDVRTLDDYRRLPFTTKAELSADQDAHPPYGTNLTYPLRDYIRVHQTSGTTGRPLRWLDTRQSWDWFAGCWRRVFDGAGLASGDRLFFAFSFGPFIGFWTAHEAARLIGAMAITGGSMSSTQRLHAIEEHRATVLVCTPTYALHLAEVAETEGIDIAGSSIRATIHAGEPGAGLPATRRRIEEAWGARCYDHAGATEVGAWGFECRARNGMHVNEAEFICEVIDPDSGEPADDGELVLTNLGRVGMPVIRYRTGDRVSRAKRACPCGSGFLRLENGVIGRIDGGIIIRGIVIYPSAVENVVRSFPEITEFAVDVYRRRSLDEMEIRVEVRGESSDSVAGDVAREARRNLGFRVGVRAVGPNTLPRFELKARRFTDHRH
ncbi:MAG: phenylacetate--CoA ligase family protein [Gemmatimonadota bacterium]|nr:phenylacetate--CoA ligase family protein [Gemmatimonadota bacterium]